MSELFGLVLPQWRRGLVLVTKMLQNLANGVYFTDKEEYMTVLNPFVKHNLQLVKRFFTQLSVWQCAR